MGFLFCGAALLLGHRWAALPLAIFYAASLVEVAVTVRGRRTWIANMAGAVAFFGLPLLFLVRDLLTQG